MVGRLHRFAAHFVAVALLVLVLSGLGHLMLNPGGDASSPTGRAVAALIEGRPFADAIRGFERVMGYRFDPAGGPDGSCSVPAAYPAFDAACRVHDLGYDLLRYAAAIDEPLGPWARLGIDRRFHRDVLAACDTRTCRALAHLYGLGVGLNSIRQGFAPPRAESGAPWAIVAALTVAVAAATAAAPEPAGSHDRARTPAVTTTPV